MTDPVTALQPTVQAWADIVLKEFDNKVRMLRIHDGELVRSFVTHVLWHAGGNLQRVEFAFAYYGKFVDMGVGRGILSERLAQNTQLAIVRNIRDAGSSADPIEL